MSSRLLTTASPVSVTVAAGGRHEESDRQQCCWSLRCAGLLNGCAYLTRASETQQGVSPPGENRSPDLSGDGRYVAFESDATYDAGDTGLHTDVFVRDNVTRSVVRVSVTSNGGRGRRFELRRVDHAHRTFRRVRIVGDQPRTGRHQRSDRRVLARPGHRPRRHLRRARRDPDRRGERRCRDHRQRPELPPVDRRTRRRIARRLPVARVEPAGVAAGYERAPGRLLRADRRHDRATDVHVHGQLQPNAGRAGERREPAARHHPTSRHLRRCLRDRGDECDAALRRHQRSRRRRHLVVLRARM